MNFLKLKKNSNLKKFKSFQMFDRTLLKFILQEKSI